MTDSSAPRSFAREDTLRLLQDRRNWGRWGPDDEYGALNLVTAAKRTQAAALVKSGRTVSLSRPFPKDSHVGNPRPALHYMDSEAKEGGGWSNDFVGVAIHGTSSTHVDALCHIWDDNGIYNGRRPADVITYKGATFGDIGKWADGIVTRGVLIDVPRFRGVDSVSQDAPVHGWELENVCRAQGLEVTPGDALVVCSGREEWSRRSGYAWGTVGPPAPTTDEGGPVRPGLHASCLEFIRDHDAAVLVWDMMDMLPNQVGLPWSMHGAIFAFGTALVDNALLEPLAIACAEEGRYEFMFVVAPLRIAGGTGSPANPLAIL